MLLHLTSSPADTEDETWDDMHSCLVYQSDNLADPLPTWPDTSHMPDIG